MIANLVFACPLACSLTCQASTAWRGRKHTGRLQRPLGRVHHLVEGEPEAGIHRVRDGEDEVRDVVVLEQLAQVRLRSPRGIALGRKEVPEGAKGVAPAGPSAAG